MSLELFSLENKTALVTGANSGLGLATARAFAAAGARIAISGRNKQKNERAAAQLADGTLVLEMDVTDESMVERGVRAVVERFGSIDVVVNNAGNFAGGPALTQPIDAWNSVIATHLTGAWLVARHAAREMIAAGRGGKIINIASLYSVLGPNDFADYASAKAGMTGLTRALAVEWAPHRIQVNAIIPGFFDTDIASGMPDWLRQMVIDKTPGRRFGRPEDMIGAAIFLASAASDWVTGVCLPVDGGYLVQDRRNDPRLFPQT